MASRKISETRPRAALKIIAMNNCKELGSMVNDIIIRKRKSLLNSPEYKEQALFGYDTDNYLVDYDSKRYGSGESNAVITESVRGDDLYIICDVANYCSKYLMKGKEVFSSPDDNFNELKRLIMAAGGHPNRITVIMPYLYEGRQNLKTHENESLDSAVALQELIDMGVENIITFDAHDGRVQNAIPIQGFDNFHTPLQFIRTIIKNVPDLNIDNDHLMCVSPDLGGMNRAVYYASQLGVDMGMFYKRKDYKTTVDGKHPVTSIEFLGNDINGRDCILIDDMIETGNTILEACTELKKRGAGRVIICATFGLFSNGLEVFDSAFSDDLFDYLFTTNLTYVTDELKSRLYYHEADLSEYIAIIIDSLNHDTSVNDIIDSSERIQKELGKFRN